MLLKSLTRHNNIKNLWNILGNIWSKASYNSDNNEIEGLWILNDLLAQGRVNHINNLYEQVAQFKTYSYLDFFILKTNKNIKRKHLDLFNREFSIFNNTIETYRGQKIKYIFPISFFTNTPLPISYCETIHVNSITHLNKRDNFIILSSDLPTTNFYNYFFIDKNNEEFIIDKATLTSINFKSLKKNTYPAIGPIYIKNKFELNKDVDFINDSRTDLLVLYFKDFYNYQDQNIFDLQENLYTVDVGYIDNFLEENVAKPLKFPVDKLPLEADLAQKKIIEFWKLNQRPYNFKQIYRLVNLLINKPYSLTLNNPEIIYEISEDGKTIKTGKLRARFFSKINNFTSLPTTLQGELTAPTNVFELNILECDNLKTLNIQNGSIIIIDNKSFKIEKVLSDTYLQLDSAISAGDPFRECKLISNQGKREYIVDNYDYSSTDKINYLVGLVKWGSKKWGAFKFGEEFLKAVDSRCAFNTIAIGNEYVYGDTFIKTILMDYDEEFEEISIIRKNIAKNKLEITDKNIKQFYKKPVLFLIPYLNYSYKLSINENNLTDWSNYAPSGTITKEIELATSFYLENTKIKFDTNINNNIYKSIDLSTNNTTGISLLRGFIKVTAGRVRFGIAYPNGFSIDSVSKKQFIDISEKDDWVFVNLFINRSEINQDSNYIRLESLEKNTEVQVFGIEFWNNVPNFTQSVHNTSGVLDELIQTNDYKIINLL